MKNNKTLTTLAEQLEIDTDLLKEILILFFENMPGQIDDMRKDLLKKDFENIHVISHTLKGTASNLYYDDIAEAAKEVEILALAKNSDSQTYEKLFNKLSLLLSQAKMNIFYE